MKNDTNVTCAGSTSRPESASTFSPFVSSDSYVVEEISVEKAAKLLRGSRRNRLAASAAGDRDKPHSQAKEKLLTEISEIA